jgi:phosphate acetyltransferase
MAFIDDIMARAKADKKTIVLPESMDKRTFEAAEKILKADMANLIIIGTPDEMNSLFAALEEIING